MKRGNKKGNSRSDSVVCLKIFPESKRSQQILGLSFGMIFSILLIVFFIIISFIVIKQFLHAQGCAEVGIFVDKFKLDVKKTWNSQIDSHTFKGILPSGIEYVCFADLSVDAQGGFEEIGYDLGLYGGKNANMFFHPTGKACEIPYHNVPNLNIERIIDKRNPNCIEVDGGKVEIKVEKKLSDKFVNIVI
ncbi:hypothetical protein CMI42_05075 [Candidatus Pacearchaeota archaeon]|nr:hypothetical protein [Candidatus Pacearchaeota archaeon]